MATSKISCVLLEGGALKCFGMGFDGRLGYGNENDIGDGAGEMGDDLLAVDLGTGRSAVQVRAGGSHTCVLLDNGDLKCFGKGEYGQLGYGNTDSLGDEAGEMGDDLPAVDLGTGRSAVQVAAGREHTCVLLDNGDLKCFGRSNFGQLGYGNENSLGDEAGEMGDALPAVDLGSGRSAVKVAAGGSHTCVLLDNGDLKCFGLGLYGQLGGGNTDYMGDDTGEMGDDLPAVDLGTGRSAVKVAVGEDHTCVILDNGDLKCFGEGEYGRLGQGNTNDLGDGAGEMGDDLPAVDLGTGRSAVQVVAGGRHTCVLLDNDDLKCFGYGFSGNLGTGNTDNLGDGAGEMGDDLLAIDLGTGRSAVQVTAGWIHNCVLLDNGDLKCFGIGLDGRLGYGNTDALGNEAGEMGDNLPAVDLGTGASSVAFWDWPAIFPPPAPPSPPPSPPAFSPFSPVAAGVTIVSVPATVVTLGLTIAGDVSSFGEEEQASLKSTLQDELSCHEPDCFLELRASAASVSVTAILTIPDSVSISVLSNVLDTANALVAQPAATISASLGVSVESAAPVTTETQVSVPLAVAPPPPSPPSSNITLPIGIAAGVAAVVVVVVAILFLRRRNGKSMRTKGRGAEATAAV